MLPCRKGVVFFNAIPKKETSRIWCHLYSCQRDGTFAMGHHEMLSKNRFFFFKKMVFLLSGFLCTVTIYIFIVPKCDIAMQKKHPFFLSKLHSFSAMYNSAIYKTEKGNPFIFTSILLNLELIKQSHWSMNSANAFCLLIMVSVLTSS